MSKPGDSIPILMEQLVSSAGPKAEAVCAGISEADKNHEPLTVARAGDAVACVVAMDLGFLGKAYDALTGANNGPIETPKPQPDPTSRAK